MDEPPPLASPDTEDPDSPYEGYDVCPCCLHENPDDSLFCHRCGAPIDPLATFVPIPRIWTEGYLMRAAATNCTNQLTLVGIWLICGLPGLTFLVLLLTGAVPLVILSFMKILFVALYFLIPLRAARSYLRNQASGSAGSPPL